MRRKSKVTQEIEDKMWELRNEGKTQKQIAEELGLSQQTVHYHLSWYFKYFPDIPDSMESVDSFIEKINQRKSDIQDIAGEDATIEQQQIAELYIQWADLRREAYEEVQMIKQTIMRIWIVLVAVIVYLISK